ncbi:hypothetical protein BDZ91DRAFT_715450 [Kalaharituber pfeilii]|nr:hypothetical protein BDZ91DRAFT_715450 [Kalaharituber pfeilii]
MGLAEFSHCFSCTDCYFCFGLQLGLRHFKLLSGFPCLLDFVRNTCCILIGIFYFTSFEIWAVGL